MVELKGSSTLGGMVAETNSAFMNMVASISSAVDQIIARLRAARSEVSGHSIWPDMLNEMVTQTRDAMTDINSEFSRGFESPSGIIPTIAGAGGQVAGSGGEGPFTSTSRQEITIPVTVMLDGDAIYRAVERRQVETLSREAGRSRRSIT